MTKSFAQMKRNSKSELDSLSEEMDKMDGGNKNADDRFWKPTVDEAGTGSAIFRFLPPPAGEDLPFVRYWDHGFQGPTGAWYIENSLTSIGQDDPCSDYNSELWATGIEANKAIVREQKRRLHHVSNIYMINDPGNPANNGKVFLYKYGKKIFDKIKLAMKPVYAEDVAIKPFNLWEGASFRLRFHKDEDGYRTYADSKFDTVSVLASPDGKKLTEKQLEEIWNSEYSLQAFLDPKLFKSYAELQARLYRVLNLDGEVAKAAAPKEEVNENEFTDSVPQFDTVNEGSAEDGDDMEFFKSLAT